MENRKRPVRESHSRFGAIIAPFESRRTIQGRFFMERTITGIVSRRSRTRTQNSPRASFVGAGFGPRSRRGLQVTAMLESVATRDVDSAGLSSFALPAGVTLCYKVLRTRWFLWVAKLLVHDVTALAGFIALSSCCSFSSPRPNLSAISILSAKTPVRAAV